MTLLSLLKFEGYSASDGLIQWKIIAIVAVLSMAMLYHLRRLGASHHVDLKQYSHFPQPDIADAVRGHIPWLEKVAVLGDPRRAFDEILYEQMDKLGYPPVLLIDFRPLEKFVMLCIFDDDVAEQVTKPSKLYSTSVPKHPAMQRLAPLVGARSLVTTDGTEWKNLRKRILPAFQPHHLLSLVDVIVEKTEMFIDLMEQKAITGESFRIDEYTTNLVFDIIGIVTFDMDLNAQLDGKQSEVLLTYRALSQAFNKRPFGERWWLQDYFTKNERDIRRLDKKLDRILKEEIKRQHGRLLAEGQSSSRSVATLSLHGIEELTPHILQQTSDTLRGFLFAGHDTTSILLQWCFYELHRCPSAASSLKAELDKTLGPDTDPKNIAKQLKGPEGSSLLSQLPYTDAVVKESLRLHPPGTTARVAPKGSGVTLTLPNGERLLVDELCLTPRAYIIQRHPKIFGETRDDFLPERWLGEAGAKIPDSAYRPYERGPRRCTGSELANLEVRIILACVARYFEFVKVGQGELEVDDKGQPQLDEKGCYRTRSKLFSTYAVTARPVDGMDVKVRIKQRC
ncbi:hypothetical protein ACN47E_005464 [Coniothyrium glycines]